MKRPLLLLMFLTTFFAVSHAQFGIKLGLNFANMISKDDDDHYDEDFKTRTGLNLGIGYDIAIGQKFAVQTGLAYSQKGFRVVDTDEDYTASLNLHYMEVPLTFAYKHTISEKLMVYGATGPCIGVAVAGKIKSDYDGDKEEVALDFGNANADDFQPLDFGWMLNAGIQYTQIRFNLGYNLGLKNIDSGSHADNYQNKNRCFQMSIGYILGAKK